MPNRRTTECRPPESRAGLPRTSGPRPSTPPEPTRCTSIFPHAPGPIPGGTKPAIKPAIYAGSAAPSKLLHRDMPSRETRLGRHGPTYLRTRSYGTDSYLYDHRTEGILRLDSLRIPLRQVRYLYLATVYVLTSDPPPSGLLSILGPRSCPYSRVKSLRD